MLGYSTNDLELIFFREILIYCREWTNVVVYYLLCMLGIVVRNVLYGVWCHDSCNTIFCKKEGLMTNENKHQISITFLFYI